MRKINILTVAFILLVFCLGLSAQTGSIYERGSTYDENTMPPSPEPASVVKYAGVPFSHSSGLAEYDVPFHTLSGHELNIPIGLHYASGGIRLDEIAGVAGLGWTLQAGGCITRTVVDMPDEYSSAILTHQMPSGTLLSDLEDMNENTSAMNYLTDLLWHRIDGSLDRYSYSVCGLSGTFVITDDGNIFQLSGDGVDISCTTAPDGSPDTFTIIGPNGTVYVLSEKETATHLGRGTEEFTPTSGEPDRWSATTAWHITQIRSRSGLETAIFTYSDPQEWDSSVYTVTRSVDITVGNTGNVPVQSVSANYIYKTHLAKVLTGISLCGQTASFTYSTGTGSTVRNSSVSQENFPFRLTGVTIMNEGNPDELVRLEVMTGRDPYDGRIILGGLRLYRGNTLDDKWTFAYKGVNTTVSRGSQDWYGFYNGENEFTDSGTHGTCPYEYSQTVGLTLTNGYPNPQYADYMSMTSADHDGAITTFIYEGCGINAGENTYNVGVRVKQINVTDGSTFKPLHIRSFTYEYPAATAPYVPLINMYTTVSMTTRPSGAAELFDWSYSFHDSPVDIGTSIRDTKIYYGKVTEDIRERMLTTGDPTVRTVYIYDTDDMIPTNYSTISRFPSDWKPYYDSMRLTPTFCSPWEGIRDGYLENAPSASPLLTRTEEYAYEDGTYTLVSSVDYTYDTAIRESVLVDYHASQITEHYQMEGYLDYNYIYHFPVYARSWSGRYPVKEVRTGYHDSGNDVAEINTVYVERPGMGSPVRVQSVSTQEAGVTRMTEYIYADTWTGGTGWISDLENQRLLDTPLKQIIRYSYDLQDITTSQSTFVDYKEEVTEYGWFSVDGTLRLLPSIYKETNLGTESWCETVLSRDCMGNISSFKQKGKPQTVVLWSYNGLYPVAVILNTDITSVAEAMGGQTVIDALTRATAPSSAHKIALSELRTSLSGVHVTTYEYIPGVGMSSVTDPAGTVTAYEYTPAGRLSCVRDHDGRKVEEYEYSLMSDSNGRRHMRSRVFRSESGEEYTEDVRWWDAFGRRIQDIAIAASGDGRDLVTAYVSDFMMHDDVKTWLPYPAENTEGEFQPGAESAAAEYHGDTKAYHYKQYEMSARDRVMAEALPGYEGTHETSYETDIANEFPVLIWEDDSITTSNNYLEGCIIREETTDADGRTNSVFKDHSGRTLGTSCGNDDPTYYVYDRYDRLRAVVGSGIQISDTLNMWRYSYDSLGRLASKGVPGAMREHYTYDDEDRLLAIMRDNVIWGMTYDAFYRVVKTSLTGPGMSNMTVEQNIYDIYPSGVTGESPKGLKTKSRIWKFDFNGVPSGYADITWSYDRMKRPVQELMVFNDGTGYRQIREYTFSGDLETMNTYGVNNDSVSTEYTYDARGRISTEIATINTSVNTPVFATTSHTYDDLGRLSATTVKLRNSVELRTERSYTIQGWLKKLDVYRNGTQLFSQELGYDGDETVAGTVPLHTGLVTRKDEAWIAPGGTAQMHIEGYAYDYAGRLSKESIDGSLTSYTYDPRGNIVSITDGSSTKSFSYDGDRPHTAFIPQELEFTHDQFGRMTFDGLSGQTIIYNNLDLVKNIKRNDTTLVNYSYLADGTKVEARRYTIGKWLIYRGPFVYRVYTTNSYYPESVEFSGGRVTRTGAMLHVKDYLGSVRAVIDGSTGTIYKASDYSAFGAESPAGSMQIEAIPNNTHPLTTITLRDGYTGKEDQTPEFGTGYIDFGARQYSPTLRRWMTPDPMSEKYYGISPYAFCSNNPVNFVDPDGKFPDIIWDIASVGFGVRSLVDNIQSGNVRGAIGDGIGIAVDVAAAALPFIPGGVGAVRAGMKTADAVGAFAKAVDNANNLAKSTDALTPITRGRMNETRVLDEFGLSKNTKNVQGKTKSGELRNTIPDAISSDTVYEVKDVQTLSNTKQIQSQIEYAKRNGFNYKIITGTNTHVSGNIPNEYIMRLDYLGPQR